MPQSPGDPLLDAARSGAILGGVPRGNLPGAASSSELLRLVAFGLDSEWYALEISHVRGIEPETEITPVPRAPAWLAGVINLHGAILPAIDPRPLLGVGSQGRKGGGLFLVFQWDNNQAALLVDSVDEMYEVSRASLEPQFSTLDGSRAELTQGQVRVRDRLIGVLALDALVDTLLQE